MTAKIYLGFMLLIAVPAFPQAISPVNPSPIQKENQMATPPPISNQAYPTIVNSEVRSNYVSGGMSFTSTYIDNLYPGAGNSSISEITYSILPTINLDQTTSRRHATISYSPGFTFYQPTSALNEVNQNANLAYHVRVTPHSTIRLSDQFLYSSMAFSPVSSAFGGGVSGSSPTLTPGILAPFAKRLTNDADGGFGWQISRSSMVGASGTATTLHYPNSSQVIGLYDASSHGGSAYYDLRIGNGKYLGAIYQYAEITAYPTNEQIKTRLHSVSAFFSIYPERHFSLSVSGGPQHYQVNESPFPTSASWGPGVSTSMGWQGLHTSFAASYSQLVTGGGGLLGAYHSKNAKATVGWQVSRNWILGANADYALNDNTTPLIFGTLENGHSVAGSALATHVISRRLSIHLEYDRLHQSYGGIKAISNNPDSDRGAVSLSWQFMRPLGK